jgi:hypothetical protein
MMASFLYALRGGFLDAGIITKCYEGSWMPLRTLKSETRNSRRSFIQGCQTIKFTVSCISWVASLYLQFFILDAQVTQWKLNGRVYDHYDMDNVEIEVKKGVVRYKFHCKTYVLPLLPSLSILILAWHTSSHPSKVIPRPQVESGTSNFKRHVTKCEGKVAPPENSSVWCWVWSGLFSVWKCDVVCWKSLSTLHHWRQTSAQHVSVSDMFWKTGKN